MCTPFEGRARSNKQRYASERPHLLKSRMPRSLAFTSSSSSFHLPCHFAKTRGIVCETCPLSIFCKVSPGLSLLIDATPLLRLHAYTTQECSLSWPPNQTRRPHNWNSSRPKIDSLLMQLVPRVCCCRGAGSGGNRRATDLSLPV